LTDHLSATLDLLDPARPGAHQRRGHDSLDPGALRQAWQLREQLAAEIENTATYYKATAKESSALLSLLADVNGQYAEAISRPDWWTRWGRHYLRSLRCAHAHQRCNNFKDPGVQLYGGSLFGQLRDEADRQFLTLPPPTPSLQRRGAYLQRTFRMDVFNNSYAPCFGGDSRVRMSDGRVVALRDLRRGDLVAMPGTQNVAAVRCLIRTACAGGLARLVSLPGGPWVTPWHPVRVLDSGGAWSFPGDIGSSQPDTPCDALYSFVLEEGHSMIMDGWECIAWGHHIVDDPVAYHPFFGCDEVLTALAELPGWDDGFVELVGCTRDRATGLVNGLVPAAAANKPLRSRIPCQVQEMQKLHEATGWTPGAEHVRPNPQTLAQKEFFLQNLARMWATPADWVFCNVFDMPVCVGPGLRTAKRPAGGLTKLMPQPFPYSLPDDVLHFVLWCSSARTEWSTDAITASIAREVDQQGGGEFVWYENPKPSIEDSQLYHVHVFWKRPAASWLYHPVSDVESSRCVSLY